MKRTAQVTDCTLDVFAAAFATRFGAEWVEGDGRPIVEGFAETLGRATLKPGATFADLAGDLADNVEALFTVGDQHPLRNEPDYQDRIRRNPFLCPVSA